MLYQNPGSRGRSKAVHSSATYRKYSKLVQLAGVVLTLLGFTAYFMHHSMIRAESQEAHLPERNHLHFVIAVTCPCAPFLGFEGGDEGELHLISTAFDHIGKHAQYVYVPYEDAVIYIENHNVEAILAFNHMRIPHNGYYLSDTLVEREFLVVTLAEKSVEIETREDISAVKTGIHPEILKALKPQLEAELTNPELLRTISNNLLLSTLLFTGEIDALITEKSVFLNTLHNVPDDAKPSRQVKLQRLFDPLYPAIIFADEALRDSFNAAWKKTMQAETGSSDASSRLRANL